MELLTDTEAEYRMLYRNGKWTAKKTTLVQHYMGDTMKNKVAKKKLCLVVVGIIM